MHTTLVDFHINTIYIGKQNRPYSAIDISANLHNKVTKGAFRETQICCDAPFYASQAEV